MKLEVELTVLNTFVKRVSRLCCSGVHEVNREDGVITRESCSAELLHLTDELLLGVIQQVLREAARDVVEALKIDIVENEEEINRMIKHTFLVDLVGWHIDVRQ